MSSPFAGGVTSGSSSSSSEVFAVEVVAGASGGLSSSTPTRSPTLTAPNPTFSPLDLTMVSPSTLMVTLPNFVSSTKLLPPRPTTVPVRPRRVSCPRGIWLESCESADTGAAVSVDARISETIESRAMGL